MGMNDTCRTCGGQGTLQAECSCYELIGGHQPGCCFHGMRLSEMADIVSTDYPCPDCSNATEVRT